MYRIIDLFAGAGGLSLGFKMTKQFEIVAIVENNKNASTTYLNNHNGLKNYEDILTVDFKQILKENGEIDVIIGGPPCQGFSNANRQRRRLINGSNELVKRYVKAIEELKPTVFVMENVKTIASDKHSFCLTHEDEEYVRKDLELEIQEKDVVLYEGGYITELRELINQNSVSSMTLVDEEQLYVLYNLSKKHKQLKKYLSKDINVKKLESILKLLNRNDQFPDWFNNTILNAHEALENILNTSTDTDIDKVRFFWNVQRLFHGILEMKEKDAIYEVITDNHQISIRMSTYIVIDFIKKSFAFLGYKTKGEVLNAADFGVPQCRERYLLIGMKEKVLKEKKIVLPESIIKNSQEYVTVKKAIADLEKYVPSVGGMAEEQIKNYTPAINSFFREIVMVPNDKKIYNHVCTDTREMALKRFEVIKQGKNFHSLPDEYKDTFENPDRTQNTIYKRLDYEKPSDTVVNVRKSMWIHPVFNRAISAREAARLQSFPDYYKFIGTKDSVYQQIGNAVPPLMGRAIAEVVLELLDCNEKYEKLVDIYKKYN